MTPTNNINIAFLFWINMLLKLVIVVLLIKTVQKVLQSDVAVDVKKMAFIYLGVLGFEVHGSSHVKNTMTAIDGFIKASFFCQVRLQQRQMITRITNSGTNSITTFKKSHD